MRNLIVSCDGTWNTPDQMKDGVPAPTNVVLLHNVLAENDAEGRTQLAYYHPGVGTDGTWWNKVWGGGTGDGLSKNIQSAYKWLCDNYRAGTASICSATAAEPIPFAACRASSCPVVC